MSHYFFTSESVTEGHPDKICDQISDAVLDAILEQDPNGRVACETTASTGLVHIMGEISTNCYVDIQKIARGVIRDIGYDRAKYGFDCDTCGIIVNIDEQSGDGKVLEGGLHRKEKCDEFVTMLKDLKLWEFCECSIEGYGLYTITVKYCPAYAARLSALLAATDDIKNHWQEFGYAGGYDTADLLGIDLKGKYSSARTSFVLGSGQIPGIGSMTGGMACPHIPGSYYLISHNTEYSDYTLNPGE